MRRKFYTVLRNGTKKLAVVPANAQSIALQTGEKRPFFILDSYAYFIDVVKLLGSRQPVLSLTGQADVQSIDSLIAEEAATHVKAILACEPRGPYMLGGCSANAIVAYEIAQQLRALGHEVGLLVIFDQPNPDLLREHSHFRLSLASWRDDWDRMHWTGFPGWAMDKVRLVIDRKVRSFRDKWDLSDDGVLEDFRLLSARADAAGKYRPAPYAGRVLLVKRMGDFTDRCLHSCWGWSHVVQGKIDICKVSAIDHREIFKSEPDRVLIARALLRGIDEVVEGSMNSDPAGSCRELAQQA